jgi:hypothetical protein
MAITTGKGNLLVDKGEKIGLGVAAVVGVGLLALGLMSALNRPQDPAEFSKDLDAKAKQLTAKMNGAPDPIDPVPDTVGQPYKFDPLAVARDRSEYYDPTVPPDPRRITPVILSVVEGQADMAVLKILANDFKLERDPMTQEVIKVKVGVVGAKNPNDKIDPEKAKEFMKSMNQRFKGKIPKKRKAPLGGGMPGGGFTGGFGGRPGGGGGYPGGGGGYPGGGSGDGRPGGGGGPGPGFGEGSGPGTGLPGGFGMTGGTTAKQEYEVTYIEGADDEEIEKQLNGRRLAITIWPQKMVVLQASFPYRAQLEMFRKALRYQKVEDLYTHPDDMPVFYGVDVQRRAYGPKGEQLEDWQTIELAVNSQDLRAVKLYYNEDSADLKRVELHEDNMLVMPLPHELTGKYPDMKLKTIKDAIEKMKKADPKNTAPPAPKTRFQGESNPFKRDEGPSAGLYNPGGEGGMMGSFFPGGGAKPGGKKGNETAPAAPEKYEPPDFIYVRAYDAEIRDGLTYEYRIRVKVKNPNYGKTDQVSKKSDAENEELPPLEEQWFVIPQKVKVPRAWDFYVIDPPVKQPNTIKPLPIPSRDKGEAVVQFQEWKERVYVNGVEEPVGDWVQSELIATRGQFVYGMAFAPVPIWSPTENAFVLREIPGEKTPKGKDPRRGVELYPVRPKTLLAVDVAGGKPPSLAAKVPPNVGQPTNRAGLVDDQSAVEALFLLPDGTMEVHSSARDKADADRKERDDHFKKWVEETEKQNPTSTQPKKGGGKEDF